MSERGFRFWWSDAVFLAVLGGAFWFLREPMGELVWIIPVAAGHFFLFCNVFRVRRSYELIWVGVFAVNMIAFTFTDAFAWWRVMAVQTPFTVAAVVAEIRSPRYHGIFTRSTESGASGRGPNTPHSPDPSAEGAPPSESG